MKPALLILLLLATTPLWGGGAGVPGPPPEERWELVSDIYLGIEVRPLSLEEWPHYREQLQAHYGHKPRRPYGLLITRIAPGSPAEKAGLQRGEVLFYNGGCRLASREDLLISLRYCRPGCPLHFVSLRGETWMMPTVVAEQRDKPIVVGYLTRPRLHAERAAELKPRQARIARMLTGDSPPDLDALHQELNSFCKLLTSGYMRGNLSLDFGLGDCSIRIAHFPAHFDRRISVTMVERGVESNCELKEAGDKLPEAMLLRLREMVEAMEQE